MYFLRYHLFLEFWLVDPWFFADWSHHHDVTRLENVRQSNIRRGKKLGFQLSHKHLPFSLTLQPCNLDFLTPVNTDFQKNVSEVCHKKVYHKVIWLTKHFYENHFMHFSGDVRKTALWKFWKIIRKTSFVAFLLKNLSCPIYPPIAIEKTDSTASVSFVCSLDFRNCCESICGAINF